MGNSKNNHKRRRLPKLNCEVAQECVQLLAGQTLVEICAFGCEFKLRRFCRVVGLDAAGKPSALDSFRPEVIERLDAHFPCSVVEHRSEEHTSELQSLMRISYAVFCLKKKK